MGSRRILAGVVFVVVFLVVAIPIELGLARRAEIAWVPYVLAFVVALAAARIVLGDFDP
jgi:hypothetical protein